MRVNAVNLILRDTLLCMQRQAVPPYAALKIQSVRMLL